MLVFSRDQHGFLLKTYAATFAPANCFHSIRTIGGRAASVRAIRGITPEIKPGGALAQGRIALVAHPFVMPTSRMMPIALIAFAACVCACSAEEKASAETQNRILKEKQQAYPALVASIEESRGKFAARWAAPGADQQAAILEEARAFIVKSVIEELFPCWIGTPWDFNGVTQKPGEGAIACGYFVSTVLRDAGFRVQRATLGQQPSQIIIQTMTSGDRIKITSNSSMENMKQVFKNRGDGLYIVGLDRHTGFVTVKGDTLTFVHSSYYTPPRAVCAEPIDGKNPFADSAYRVIGKIPDEESVRKWILGEDIGIRK